jgi:hypothetical protein
MGEQLDYELQVCVTHWRIYQAWRREPWANFGFKLCPIEEGTEHEVVNFVSANHAWPAETSSGGCEITNV